MDDTRPSLRQLAAAADVTVPTLRHYFGTREDLIEAVLVEYRRMGDPYIKLSCEPEGPFAESIRSYLKYLHSMLVDYPFLGDVFAIGFLEGLFNHKLGPVCLSTLVDPMVEALEARLSAHQERGEMISGNVRYGALMLISPVLLACHHQFQMYGRQLRPLDFTDMLEGLGSVFIRAYGVERADN
jgi:AcrR family transcriptional regulator